MTSSVSIGEKAAVFNYGFLSIKTSRLLNKIEKNHLEALVEDDYKTAERAEQFLNKIINGQMLMAGERVGFTPSAESVEAVSYALSALSILQDEGRINIKELSMIKQIFESMRNEINKILNRQLDQIDKGTLALSRHFFLQVSRGLVSDAQEIVQLRPPIKY